MVNIATLNGKEISLIKINVNSQLNTKQKALLMMLHKCMTDNRSFNWDYMVEFYVKNVKKNYPRYRYDINWDTMKKINERYDKIDIKKSYLSNDNNWWFIKQSIRQWFATNIGSMVLKGSILALPIIEID
jgi:hypothetical protein